MDMITELINKITAGLAEDSDINELGLLIFPQIPGETNEAWHERCDVFFKPPEIEDIDRIYNYDE
jgi:hypothetical protein